jgi:GntR family transcriptional regulator, rspAB operon transcriptional repressor
MVDGAYAALLNAIVERRLGVGTSLSQNKLAAHLGISRTPVREALLRLERDGLVDRTSDGGFVVGTITTDEVEEACDLLEMLDTFVYLRAADALTPAEHAELAQLAATLVDSVESGDSTAWKVADRRYHRIVMDAAGNRFAAESVQQVRQRVQRFWLQEPLFDGRLRTCAQDHVALARALAERDEQLLTDTVRSHVETMRRGVLQSLSSVAPLLPQRDPLSAVGQGRS